MSPNGHPSRGAFLPHLNQLLLEDALEVLQYGGLCPNGESLQVGMRNRREYHLHRAVDWANTGGSKYIWRQHYTIDLTFDENLHCDLCPRQLRRWLSWHDRNWDCAGTVDSELEDVLLFTYLDAVGAEVRDGR